MLYTKRNNASDDDDREKCSGVEGGDLTVSVDSEQKMAARCATTKPLEALALDSAKETSEDRPSS